MLIQTQNRSCAGLQTFSYRTWVSKALHIWVGASDYESVPAAEEKDVVSFLVWDLWPILTYIDLYWPIVLNPQKPWGGWFFLWFKAFIYIGFWCFFVGWFFQPGSVAPATGHFQLSFLEKNKTPDLKAQEAQSQHSVWLSKSLTTVCSMACAWLSWWSWAESLHQAFLMNLRKSG